MKNFIDLTWRPNIFGVLLLLVLVYVVGHFMLQPDFIHYKAGPVSGQVIDIETGEPLDGVNVAVYWQLYYNGFVIYSESDQATIVKGVYETATDKDGRFFIPGWEGYINDDQNKVGSESPIIGLYKQGYLFKQVSNFTSSWGNENHRILENRNFPREKQTEDGVVHLSIWDDFPIELEKSDNNIKKITSALNKADRFIDRVRSSRNKICHKKYIENFIAAYSVEATRVKKLIKEKHQDENIVDLFNTYSDIDFDCGHIN